MAQDILSQILAPDEEDEVEPQPRADFDATAMIEDILTRQQAPAQTSPEVSSEVPRGEPMPLDDIEPQQFGFEDYEAPPEDSWLEDMGNRLSDMGSAEHIEDTMQMGIDWATGKPAMAIGEYIGDVIEDPQRLIYDLTDTSLEPYISDAERAELPFDDPNRDAVSSVMIGDWLAGLATKIAPAYGKQVLKNAPEIASTMTKKVTGDLVDMKPTMNMLDDADGVFDDIDQSMLPDVDNKPISKTGGENYEYQNRAGTSNPRIAELQAEAQAVGQANAGGGRTAGGVPARETEQWSDVPSRQIEQTELIPDSENNTIKILQEHQKEMGLPVTDLKSSTESSIQSQGAIAKAFDVAPRIADDSPEMKDAIFQTYVEHRPDILEATGATNYDELVKATYASAGEDTVTVFNLLPQKMTFHDGKLDYPDSKTMRYDVRANNHLSVFRGGDKHELWGEPDPITGLTLNDQFRATHDIIAHTTQNNEFGRKGEQMGTGIHKQTIRTASEPAVVMETRGQNSVVNMSPLNLKLRQQQSKLREDINHAKRTSPEDVPALEKALKDSFKGLKFADQKAGVLPAQMLDEDFDGVMPASIQALMKPEGDSTLGRHFSNQEDIDVLSPSKAGTASAGKEKARTEKLPEQLKGIQFYMEGAKPEGMVVAKAKSLNETQLDNLYPMKSDPMGIRELVDEGHYASPDDKRNEFAKQVYNNGYKGYHDGNVAVVTGDTPVTKLEGLSGLVGKDKFDRAKSLMEKKKPAKKARRKASKKIKGGTTVKHGSRAEAEAQGYWHPIGEGKKLKKPVPEFRSEKQELDIEPRKVITPEDLFGEFIIPASGDRTSAGKILTSVGGHDFRDPIRLEGGMDYMRDNPEGIWASGKSVVSKLMSTAQPAIDSGDAVNMVYMPMNHKATNFSTMMTDALFEQIVSGDVSKTAQNLFDRELKKLRPEWKGLSHPDAQRQLRGVSKNAGALRHAFADVAKLENFQKRGFPDLAETRYAITEESLLDVPLHHGGQSIGRMSGDVVSNPVQPHTTYESVIGGDYVGGFDQAVPRDILFPDFYKQRRAENKPESRDFRAFSMQKVLQKADQAWLDDIMEYLRGAE